jgi:hypothetical protein
MNKLSKENAMLELQNSFKKLLEFSKVKFEDVPLKDGSKLAIEDGSTIDIGCPIYRLDDKGNQVAVDDGDYILQDGRTVTIEGGLVKVLAGPDKTTSDVETPQSDASNTNVDKETMDAATAPQDKAPDAPTEDGGDLASRVSQLETTLEQIMEMLQGMMNSQEQNMKKVSEFSSKLKDLENQPASAPIKMERNMYTQPSMNKFANIIPVDDDSNQRQELIKKARLRNSPSRLSDSTSK